MIKVLIADDHDIVRQGFTLVLKEFTDIEMVGEARSGEEAVTLARKNQPDLVLMDVRMPGIGGLAATKKILKRHPAIKVIGLSGYNDGAYPNMFVRAGASGYLTKYADANEIALAIRQVHGGQIYLDGHVSEQIDEKTWDGAENRFSELSDRELQVATLIAECYSPVDIAKRLGLGIGSINSYLVRIYEKLGVHSDVELTLLALRCNMITPQGFSDADIARLNEIDNDIDIETDS